MLFYQAFTQFLTYLTFDKVLLFTNEAYIKVDKTMSLLVSVVLILIVCLCILRFNGIRMYTHTLSSLQSVRLREQ